ncbi:MAG: 5-carboxymethyl-2-hydroxymuconate Delta-isomerase [Vibrio sp.]
MRAVVWELYKPKVGSEQIVPHIVLEYSNRIEERANIQSILEDLHQITIASGLFSIDLIKSRAIRINDWLVADQNDNVDFAHLTVEMLAGRSEAQRKALAEALCESLQSQLDFVASITVNIREMDPSCFQGVSRL